MAKSFTRPPVRPPAVLPTSNQDFFDLLAAAPEPADAVAPLPVMATPDEVLPLPRKSPAKPSRRVRRPASAEQVASPAGEAAGLTQPAAAPVDEESTRQTFVLGRHYLEQLLDFVHARRTQGDYRYSQRQALEEALRLLFASRPPAPPRPAETREQEQQQRARIQKGRRAGPAATRPQSPADSPG